MAIHGLVSLTNANATVGSSSTQILAAAASAAVREVVIIGNDSDEDVYVSLGITAEMNKGIYLASGSTVVLAGVLRFTGVINAICTSGGKNVSIQHGY